MSIHSGALLVLTEAQTRSAAFRRGLVRLAVDYICFLEAEFVAPDFERMCWARLVSRKKNQ